MCTFVGSIALKLCEEGVWEAQDCHTLVGFSSAFRVSMVLVGATAAVLFITAVVIWWQLVSSLKARPTLRLRSTGAEPELSLPASKRFHIFMSHTCTHRMEA